jgi:hypothetical protein
MSTPHFAGQKLYPQQKTKIATGNLAKLSIDMA